MRFYLCHSIRNILNNKRHMALFSFSIFVSMTILFSLTIWTNSSEDFLIADFLDDVDYELRIHSFDPATIHDITGWLNNRSEVLSADEYYFNSAFFNAEDKSPFYSFLPFSSQLDQDNPVIHSPLLLPTQEALSRIENQFSVEGEFSLKTHEVLLSSEQAQQLANVLNQSIVPGTHLNLSINRNSPDVGYTFLYSYLPLHFYNVTVKGIYSAKPSSTTLQEEFSDSYIYNSIIFLQENLNSSDITLMEDNGLNPVILTKLTSNFLSNKGIDGLYPQAEYFRAILTTRNPTIVAYLLEEPFTKLVLSYHQLSTHFIILLPLVTLGLLTSIIISNQIIIERKNYLKTLANYNASRKQIIGLICFEFLVVIFFVSFLALMCSFIFAALIPTFTTGNLSFENFAIFFSSLNFPFLVYFPTLFSYLAVIILFISIRTTQSYNQTLEERQKKSRKKFLAIVSLVSWLVITLSLLGYLIYRSVVFNQEIKFASPFSLSQVNDSAELLVLFLIFSQSFLILIAIGLAFLLSKSKKILDKIFPTSSFFIAHRFKSNRNEFGIILLLSILFVSTSITNLTLANTLNINEQQTIFYNEGADLRIQTVPTHYQFASNLSTYSEIEEATPIFKLSGKVQYRSLTIYGIDPEKFARIARWHSSSFNMRYYPTTYQKMNISELLQQLTLQPYGIIISEGLAETYNYKIGDLIRIRDITIPFGGGGDSQFLIVGIIHSAPGFGLSTDSSDDIVFVNEIRMIVDYQLEYVELFYATKSPEFPISIVENMLSTSSSILVVNPPVSVKSTIEVYVERYVPDIQFFLYLETLLVITLCSVLIFSYFNFSLERRKLVESIYIALGSTFKRLVKDLLIELVIILFMSFLLGFSYSILLAYLVLEITTPFFLEEKIIPIMPIIQPICTIILVALLSFIISLSIQPFISNMQTKKLAFLLKE